MRIVYGQMAPRLYNSIKFTQSRPQAKIMERDFGRSLSFACRTSVRTLLCTKDKQNTDVILLHQIESSDTDLGTNAAWSSTYNLQSKGYLVIW